MNAFQACRNTSDAVPLYLPQQLYLKPCATISISVQLTQKMMGKTIIHGEMIQKLKTLILPDEFTSIKVTKTTIDVVRFEAELELKAYVQRVLSKLDNKSIKLKDIPQLMKVKSCEAKSDFPTRHEWDAYFRDAKDMNEMKFGERPDTVHISNLPTKWFISSKYSGEAKCTDENLLPSEKLFYYTFEKFGAIRNVDIPICDPYRNKMKAHISGIQTSSFDDTEFFEGYVQFKDYLGFVDCMDAIRGMRLMRTDRKGEAQTLKIFVAFDKSKHLSEGAIRRRDILRERLILKQRTKEDKEKLQQEEKDIKESAEKKKTDDLRTEKERRRHQREEKRKAKILAELKGKGNDEFNEKIAKEEKKLLKVQRRLEAIRLVDDLFKRLECKLDLPHKSSQLANGPTNDKKGSELKKMRLDYEQELKTQRDKLHKAIEGRVILRSIVSTTTKEVCDGNESASSADETDSIGDPKRDAEKVYPTHPLNALNEWYWQNQLMAYNAIPPFYGAPAPAPTRGYYFPNRGNRGFAAGPSTGGNYQRRPFRGRGRGGYNRGSGGHKDAQHYHHPLQRYYSKSRSKSRSRSRSRSYSRYRDKSSRSRSRSRSKSKSRRHRSYSHKSRSRSRSRSRSKSRHTPSRSRSPSDTRQVTSSKSRRSHSRSRS